MRLSLLLMLSIAPFISGCSSEPVKPWERGTLATDEMQLVPDRVEDYFDSHIYSSREGAFGGKGAGGGGCGCN